MQLAQEKKSPLLVLAVSGRIGSGATIVGEKLKDCLQMFRYETEIIKVSELLAKPEGQLASMPNLPSVIETGRAERMESLQDRGDFYRSKFGVDILAGLCIHHIAATINPEQFYDSNYRRAFIIDSLKHPGEVRLLKQVFGDAFILVGVVASDLTRRTRLIQHKGFTEDFFAKLSKRDGNDESDRGQHSIKTVVEADYFFANDYPKKEDLLVEASRFMNLVFRIGLQSPTREEVGMQMAAEAASRSACLSRQVGAALYSSDGLVLATGHNDVPQFGGGLYGSNAEIDDRRCYAWGAKCHNDEHKNDILNHLFGVITEIITEHQKADADKIDLSRLKEELTTAISSSSKIKNLTEFSRAIHAEMDAIISVARKALDGLVGSTLYCTTFPCHNCAKHIIGAGIHRVVYLEPYEKSLARELHSDAINDPLQAKEENKVSFDLYGGVSPYKFDAFFRMREKRKPDDGSGKFLDHDKERTTRLPFVAQDPVQLEPKIRHVYEQINDLVRDAKQLPLKLQT